MIANSCRELVRKVIVAFPADFSLASNEHARVRACMRGVAGEALPAIEGVMQGGAGILFHQVFVTLVAQRRFNGTEKATLIRTVTSMTRYAIPPPYGGVHVRLGEFGLQLCMAGVTDRVGSIGEDVRNVRTMGVVTFGAGLVLIG
jgi:hypothetical protein